MSKTRLNPGVHASCLEKRSHGFTLPSGPTVCLIWGISPDKHTPKMVIEPPKKGRTFGSISVVRSAEWTLGKQGASSWLIELNGKPFPPKVCVWVRGCVGAWVRACVGAWVRGAWVRGCVGAWVRGCVGAWVRGRGCVGAWVRGCVGAWVRGCVGAWVRWCVGAWVGGWVGACVRACVGGRVGVCVCVLFFTMFIVYSYYFKVESAEQIWAWQARLLLQERAQVFAGLQPVGRPVLLSRCLNITLRALMPFVWKGSLAKSCKPSGLRSLASKDNQAVRLCVWHVKGTQGLERIQRVT